MYQSTVSEWVEAGMDRRQLRQPRHLLQSREDYSLYCYGDVFDPDGEPLGHIDELDDNTDLPDAMRGDWGAFVKYWHGQDNLDRWDDLFGGGIRLDRRTGRYVIVLEDAPVPGSFTTISAALRKADPDLFAAVHSDRGVE